MWRRAVVLSERMILFNALLFQWSTMHNHGCRNHLATVAVRLDTRIFSDATPGSNPGVLMLHLLHTLANLFLAGSLTWRLQRFERPFEHLWEGFWLLVK